MDKQQTEDAKVAQIDHKGKDYYGNIPYAFHRANVKAELWCSPDAFKFSFRPWQPAK